MWICPLHLYRQKVPKRLNCSMAKHHFFMHTCKTLSCIPTYFCIHSIDFFHKYAIHMLLSPSVEFFLLKCKIFSLTLITLLKNEQLFHVWKSNLTTTLRMAVKKPKSRTNSRVYKHQFCYGLHFLNINSCESIN